MQINEMLSSAWSISEVLRHDELLLREVNSLLEGKLTNNVTRTQLLGLIRSAVRDGSISTATLLDIIAKKGVE